MKFLVLSAFIAPLLTVSLAKTTLADIADLDTVCSINTAVPAHYIGKDKNVLVQAALCPLDLIHQRSLEERQTASVNECGANCATNCFSGSSGGPNGGDCTVIADALLYASQNTGPQFDISTGTTNNPLYMQYKSCKTFYVNQATFNQTYCRADWAALVSWLSSDCSGTNGAHGGNCVANDGAWFVQVQHS